MLMRVVSLLTTTLVLAASAFGQQAPASPQNSAQSAPPSQVSTADQPPTHPITPAQVHELLELTGANRLKVQMMRGMMSQIVKAFPPFVPKDVIDDLEASMEKIDIEPLAVKAYQKHVSTEDAAQVIAFYKTPAGRRVVSVLPQITQELQESGAQEGIRISQAVVQRHMDEIRTAAAKYQQDHADTPHITTPN